MKKYNHSNIHIDFKKFNICLLTLIIFITLLTACGNREITLEDIRDNMKTIPEQVTTRNYTATGNVDFSLETEIVNVSTDCEDMLNAYGDYLNIDCASPLDLELLFNISSNGYLQDNTLNGTVTVSGDTITNIRPISDNIDSHYEFSDTINKNINTPNDNSINNSIVSTLLESYIIHNNHCDNDSVQDSNAYFSPKNKVQIEYLSDNKDLIQITHTYILNREIFEYVINNYDEREKKCINSLLSVIPINENESLSIDTLYNILLTGEPYANISIPITITTTFTQIKKWNKSEFIIKDMQVSLLDETNISLSNETVASLIKLLSQEDYKKYYHLDFGVNITEKTTGIFSIKWD